MSPKDLTVFFGRHFRNSGAQSRTSVAKKGRTRDVATMAVFGILTDEMVWRDPMAGEKTFEPHELSRLSKFSQNERLFYFSMLARVPSMKAKPPLTQDCAGHLVDEGLHLAGDLREAGFRWMEAAVFLDRIAAARRDTPTVDRAVQQGRSSVPIANSDVAGGDVTQPLALAAGLTTRTPATVLPLADRAIQAARAVPVPSNTPAGTAVLTSPDDAATPSYAAPPAHSSVASGGVAQPGASAEWATRTDAPALRPIRPAPPVPSQPSHPIEAGLWSMPNTSAGVPKSLARITVLAQTLAAVAVLARNSTGEFVLKPDTGTALALKMLSDSEFDALLPLVVALVLPNPREGERCELEARIRAVCGRPAALLPGTLGHPSHAVGNLGDVVPVVGAWRRRNIRRLLDDECTAAKLKAAAGGRAANSTAAKGVAAKGVAAEGAAECPLAAAQYDAFLKCHHVTDWPAITGRPVSVEEYILRDIVARAAYWNVSGASDGGANVRLPILPDGTINVKEFIKPWLETIGSESEREELAYGAECIFSGAEESCCNLEEDLTKALNYFAEVATTVRKDIERALRPCWRRMFAFCGA